MKKTKMVNEIEAETDQLLTTEQAANMLGLAPGTLRKLRSEGQSPVPAYKPFNEKTIRYRLSEIQDLIRNAPLRPEGVGVFTKPGKFNP